MLPIAIGAKVGLGDDYPAYYISWNDVQAFITKLNAMSGQNFRMPTEAEWEFAAKGGNQSHGYIYSGSDTADDVAWYKGNSGGKTHPVGTKQPNELGIYDMTGNVSEWCSDFHAPYTDADATDPTGPSTASGHVIRGGNWDFVNSNCRAVSRNSIDPTFRFDYIGFRLALNISK